MKKLFAGMILGLSAMVANATLTLEVNPNQDGEWLLHLTGTTEGTSVNYWNDLSQSTSWNQIQGGVGGSYLTDGIEPFVISGTSKADMVKADIVDAFDVGDNVVVGDGLLMGITIAKNYGIALKMDSSFSSNTNSGVAASTVSEWASADFNETLLMKPAAGVVFSDVWNVGTFSGDGLDIIVSSEVIPEPAAMGLLGSSCTGLFLLRTIRRRKLMGQTLLPVRRVRMCDEFCSESEWAARQAALIEYQPTALDLVLRYAVSEIAGLWLKCREFLARVDKAFWNFMVCRYERRIARRKALHKAVKKTFVSGLDAFLAVIMK